MRFFRFFSLIPLLTVLLGQQDVCGDVLKTLEIPEDCSLVADNVSNKSSSDSYLEAYIQGVVDTKYPDTGLSVSVRNGDVFLTNLPADGLKAQEIIQFVTTLTKHAVKGAAVPGRQVDKVVAEDFSKHPWYGVWLPQSTILFPTQIANPRQICFSAGWRFRDKIAGPIATEVTFGDQFPIYRWANFRGGDLQLEIEGGVYGIFNMRKKTFPLVNTDYYGGIPLTFAKGPWSYRLRLYHISTHVGDEFLQESHHHFHRKNKSFEAVDLSADYQFHPNLRVYGVLGTIAHSDEEMSMKRGYVEYGFEARGPRTDFEQLFGQPFLACHMQNWQENHFALDKTYALGYEWGKIHGIGRKVRVFLEYHDGFSPDGQFSRIRTKFFSVRLAYGF